MNKISVLFIIDGLEFGGGERVFLQLAAGLKDCFKVFVAATRGGKFENGIRELGVKFFPVDMSRQLSLRPIRQLSGIIKNNKIDLVHSQGARADFYARIAGRVAGSPHNLCTIAMPVEGFEVRPWRRMIYRSIDSLAERYVDKFIVVSDALKRILIEKRGIPGHRITRIYNGIELDHYHPDAEDVKMRKEWGIPQDVPIIGAIGRMVWQKGFECLIRAIPEVVQAVPDAKFIFVGDGPIKDQLIVKSEQLNVRDRIVFAGFRSDINEILAAVDLLVVPSLLEGFPMITLEAMTMAKPIVATSIDGITEQITDGENGIMVLPKDHIALAEAILRLIKDKELSKKLGMSARKRVEQEFSVAKMVEETEKVYMSLLSTS